MLISTNDVIDKYNIFVHKPLYSEDIGSLQEGGKTAGKKLPLQTFVPCEVKVKETWKEDFLEACEEINFLALKCQTSVWQ